MLSMCTLYGFVLVRGLEKDFFFFKVSFWSWEFLTGFGKILFM
jgi:hypothetical protein